MTTLIFPSTVPEAHAEARRQRITGERIIGAASVSPNHPDGTFDEWFRLPTIYEDDFVEALRSVIAVTGAKTLIAPSAAVHDALSSLADDGRLPCRLRGEQPIRSAMSEWAARRNRAAAAADWIYSAVGAEVDPTLLKAALSVPALVHGESNEDKLIGLIAAAVTAPAGDFVEIGVAMGRSAAVLALAARERGHGMLTIDPWTKANMQQADVSDSLNSLMNAWSPELMSDAFYAHLRLVTQGPFAHVRLPSTEGAKQYRAGELFETAGFHPLVCAGRIALLHIDGNHDLSAVAADWQAWSPHLAPGAWVVFDDYHWTHGDGPQIVADEAYAMGALPGAFSAGGALFFRRSA